jgi:hypothetical protein
MLGIFSPRGRTGPWLRNRLMGCCFTDEPVF